MTEDSKTTEAAKGADCLPHLVGCDVRSAMEEAFRKCTRRYDGNASLGYEVSCRLGNWSVSGPDKGQVEREAYHYWQQYWQDGDYNELLSSNA